MRQMKQVHEDSKQITTDYETFQNSESNNNQRQQLTSRKKYGNMIVLFESNFFLISIGPDYICSIIAIAIFIVLDYFTVKTVFSNSENQVLRGFTLGGAIFQIFIYLLILISNPGIATKEEFEEHSQQEIKRYCQVCEIPMMPRTRHCEDCDVCIKGYDHHCPWTSKCIGKGNYLRFNIFVSSLVIYFFYCMIVLSVMGMQH